MRQVPQPHYAIIGNGRMARHICHYFRFLKLHFSTWSRSQNTISSLQETLQSATHALILINDAAIDDFIEQHILSTHPYVICIHFSGCLQSKFAYTAHPLQTFTPTLYSLEEYKKIPFVLFDKSIPFSQLLPGIHNPNYCLQKKDQAYYHSLCVMANNFSTLLWKKFYFEMQSKFNISSIHLDPYLKKTFENIKETQGKFLSGPLQRGDKKTIKQNLNSLIKDDFHSIYQSFVDLFNQEI